MEDQIVYIKHMVCHRCVLAVEQIFEEIGYPNATVNMGNAHVKELNPEQQNLLSEKLEEIGFKLMDNPEEILVERVKLIIIEMIHNQGSYDKNIKNSIYLSQRLNQSYGSLSKLFSKYQETTLEKYIILQKIERIKELLEYGELNVSEIADQLGYGSLSHMSRQFKSITGSSPIDYKKNAEGRKGIDAI
jgi:AraC family transcriptional regulator